MNSSGKYRRLLCLGTAATFFMPMLLIGCGKDNKPERKPIAIASDARCTLCGMIIRNYPGPKAELFIKGVDEAVTFCSARDAFTFALQPENARRLEGFFLQNAALGEDALPEAQSFLDVSKAVLVMDSRREGIMGAEPVAFANEKEAKAFITKMGGRIVKYEDITLETLA